METIGEWAAKAIRQRAEQNGTTILQECKNTNCTRQIMKNWEEYGFNPNAYYLQQMALAGYDVIWILTGKENKNAEN